MRLDFLIASAAAAHNEADREYSSFSLLPRLPVPGKQHASRLAPHVLHGLADGRQLRFHQPSGEDSVESGDDDVVGNPDTGLLEEFDHAEGGLSVPQTKACGSLPDPIASHKPTMYSSDVAKESSNSASLESRPRSSRHF